MFEEFNYSKYIFLEFQINWWMPHSFLLLFDYSIAFCGLLIIFTPFFSWLNPCPWFILHGRHVRLDKNPDKSYRWNSTIVLFKMLLVRNLLRYLCCTFLKNSLLLKVLHVSPFPHWPIPTCSCPPAHALIPPTMLYFSKQIFYSFINLLSFTRSSTLNF